MEYDYLWEGGPKILKGEGFRLSTDSVLLGNFVSPRGTGRGIDLGCAGGILSLLILARAPEYHMTGIEWDPDEVERARHNMEINGFTDRSELLCADLRNYRELFRAGSFDLVISNPPYFPSGSGPCSPDENRSRARDEKTCTLQDVLSCAGYLCRYGGKAVFVHKPERLSELLCGMVACGLEPKRLRMVAKNAEATPSLVLVEGRRGGAPGLKVEPLLVLQDSSGGESEEIKKIYRRNP